MNHLRIVPLVLVATLSFAATAQAAPVVVTEMALGESHACALLGRGDVKCWGANYYGQLGLGDDDDRGDQAGEMGDVLPVVDLDGVDITQIAAGAHHTCAVFGKGVIKCWGRNDHGQLGLGDTVQRGDDAGEMGVNLPAVSLGNGLMAKKIEAGGAHTCAIMSDDSLRCWGHNQSGQLGEGSIFDRGNAGGEMGTFRSAVDLGTGRHAVQMSLGLSHTCAVLDDGSLKCWGSNSSGQLGLGDANNRGDEVGEMGDDLPAVDLGSNRTAIRVKAGYLHTCALLDDASVKCWGANLDGQLGLEDMNARGLAAADMGDSLDEVALMGIVTWPPPAVSRLTTGDRHSCVIFGSTLKCWGDNSGGQLGAGHRNDLGNASGEMGSSLPAIDMGTGRRANSVAGGHKFSCAKLDNHRLKCWGENISGVLGQGDNRARGVYSGELGDALPEIDLGMR